MRYDYLFYIVGGLNVLLSFVAANPISSALGWSWAIGYCWAFNSDKFVPKQESEVAA